MKPGYETKTIGGALMWLDEECAEVGQTCSKTTRVAFEVKEAAAGDPPISRHDCIVWALTCYNPELPADERESNRDWILREIADLELAILAVKTALRP